MKNEEKEKAISMRQCGMSMKNIAKELGVSQSSVSAWVKDVVLTTDQIENLKLNNPVYNNNCAGPKAKSDQARNLRLLYQEEGRLKAKEMNLLHMAGCMLYWAEGSKNRNTCKLSNSDPNLLIFFKKFLYENYNLTSENIKVYINCVTTNGITVDEIEQYWSDKLSFPRSCFGKTSTDILSKYSQQKKSKNKLIYGTATITVHSTKIVQNIFGAIQEYGNFTDTKWIDNL